MEMLPLNSGKDNLSSCTAVFDVVFPPRGWNLSRGRVEMHWNPFGSAEWWIMVLVEPESNKTLSILLDGQLPMMLQVATTHDNSLGCSGANTNCTDAEAWKDSRGDNRIVSRWWHSFILELYQWWSQGLGKNCSNGSRAGTLTQVLPRSQVSVKNSLRRVLGSPGGSVKSTSHGSQ